MFFIESERLRLIPLTHKLLQLWHSNRAEMEMAAGLAISNQQIDDLYIKEIEDAMINFWLPKTIANPETYLWYTCWEVILKSTNTSIGGMGFAGEPNENGEAETGYMIDKQHHNKGYATEALRLLTTWAFADDAVKCIVVHTFEDNLPSRRILAKCGFEETDKDETGLMTFKLIKACPLINKPSSGPCL
jgi:ribosomal-protein-alanine N-acetyltransferase